MNIKKEYKTPKAEVMASRIRASILVGSDPTKPGFSVGGDNDKVADEGEQLARKRMSVVD